MRAYQDTITWLTFRVEPRKAPPSFWLQLGQLDAGLRHLNGVPLAAAEARSVERDLVVRGVQSRLALDGVILPYEAIRSHLAGGSKPGARVAGRAEVLGFLSSLIGTGTMAHPQSTNVSPKASSASMRPFSLAAVTRIERGIGGSSRPVDDLGKVCPMRWSDSSQKNCATG
jgi:hypothetical protein